MRVLITVGFLGQFGETDGVVTTYRNLLPFYEKSGLQVDLLAYGPEDRVLERGRVRILVHRPRVPLRVDPIRWIDLGFGATRLARSLWRVPYDLVQSSTPDPMGVWGQGLARGRCPFLAFYHTALAEYAAIRGRCTAGPIGGRVLGGIMEHWLRRYFDRADRILAPSRSVERELAGRFRPPVAVLGRGVDSSAFHPSKRRRPDGRVRALYVGRVAPEKNLDLLARIFESRADCELVVVGDGPCQEAMRRRLPRAWFSGRLEGEALAQAYADADFFVFPSRTDTLGNVVLEAMASGLPVVVSDSMGPKELVEDGSTGFVAASDQAFASAVAKLAADGARRAEMGRAARGFAETRSWAAIFDGLMSHYQELRSAELAA
jgi:glycosyltransferase involved in cell wall biosynthesis